MEEKLKPCPFCGCERELMIHAEHMSGGKVVTCHTCDAVGPLGDDEADARKLWNERKA
jgi:Lar family restriction alleviation protein